MYCRDHGQEQNYGLLDKPPRCSVCDLHLEYGGPTTAGIQWILEQVRASLREPRWLREMDVLGCTSDLTVYLQGWRYWGLSRGEERLIQFWFYNTRIT